jgi:hypothetical protein
MKIYKNMAWLILIILIVPFNLIGFGSGYNTTDLEQNQSGRARQLDDLSAHSFTIPYTFENVTIDENKTYVINITLPRNVEFLNVSMNLDFEKALGYSRLKPAWDFSIAKSSADSRYPLESNYSSHQFLYTGFNGTDYFRALMGFKLPDNIKISEITEANLTFHLGDGSNSTQYQEISNTSTFEFYAVENTTEPGGSTWDTQPFFLHSHPLMAVSIPPSNDEDFGINFDTNVVNNWLEASNNTLWFTIKGENESNHVDRTLKVLHSSEHPDALTHPEFMIDYLTVVENLRLGWWLGSLQTSPGIEWNSVNSEELSSLEFDTTTFQSYLDNTPGSYDANSVVPFKFTTNRTTSFDKIELQVTVVYADTDNDGFTDDADLYPTDPTQWADTDSDGYGNNPTGTNGDKFPLDPTQWTDSDGDGYGDNSEGANPDIAPDDNTLSHPIQQIDDYVDYVNDQSFYTIRQPSMYITSSMDDGRGVHDGVYYTHLAIFREPDEYTSRARIEIKAMEDFDAVNSESYVTDLMSSILDFVSSNMDDFQILEGPRYFTELDRWYAEAEAVYNLSGRMVVTKWWVTVSESNEYYYVLSATVSSEKYSEYEHFFNVIFESFEIDEGDILSIVASVCVVIVIIAILIGMVVYKTKRTQTTTTPKPTAPPPLSYPKSPPSQTKPPTYPQPSPSYPSRTQTRTTATSRQSSTRSTVGASIYCSQCGGIGVCNECDGLGTVNKGMFGQNVVDCPTCKGLGMCPKCRTK